MTEFTEEEQLIILEILYTLKVHRLPREIVMDEMDNNDVYKILDKAVEILNKQAKEQAN
jgi:hypothetical protein